MRDFIAELKKKKRDLTIGGIATLIAMFLCAKTPYDLLIFVPIIGYIIFSVKICPISQYTLSMWSAPNEV